MPGATPACCKWERAPGCVLLADIHGSRSDRVRARASVCVCVCVRTTCTVLAAGEVAEEEGAGWRGGGARARRWGSRSPPSRLPPSAA